MTKSLFECILNSDEYIDYLDDIAKLCAIIIMYYVLHSGDQNTLYLFDAENSIIIFIGLNAYHLIFNKILSFSSSQ